MIGLLQRVTSASVVIDGQKHASILEGLLVLVAIENNDDENNAERLLEKLINYRVFPDENGRMNLSLADTQGGLLLVPQFTLAADTKSGLRPSFTSAARPEASKKLFDFLCDLGRKKYKHTDTGIFGADMKVSLVNDGPVTFWLQV